MANIKTFPVDLIMALAFLSLTPKVLPVILKGKLSLFANF